MGKGGKESRLFLTEAKIALKNSAVTNDRSMALPSYTEHKVIRQSKQYNDENKKEPASKVNESNVP